MKLQKGCFVLFDNNRGRTSLDEFLKKQSDDVNIIEPLIKEYILGYNEIFNKHPVDDYS